MKERLLEELQKGSKGAVMKKHIITYLIYNENSTITDLAKVTMFANIDSG